MSINLQCHGRSPPVSFVRWVQPMQITWAMSFSGLLCIVRPSPPQGRNNLPLLPAHSAPGDARVLKTKPVFCLLRRENVRRTGCRWLLRRRAVSTWSLAPLRVRYFCCAFVSKTGLYVERYGDSVWVACLTALKGCNAQPHGIHKCV